MARIWRYPVILPTTGTSGSFPIKAPWETSYVAVINTTAASIYVAEGQIYLQPPEAILFSQNVAMSAPLNHAVNTITVFWNSGATALGTTNNQAVIILSDEPINLQAGVNSSGGVASNVNVQNTISATLTGTNNVTLQPSTNQIGHVVLDAGTNVAGHFVIDNGSGSSPDITPNYQDAVASTYPKLATASMLWGFNGTGFDRLRVDSQKNLLVGLRSSGGFEPLINGGYGDGAANTDNGIKTWSNLQGFNGTTWDRLRVDGNKNLQVSLRSSGGTEPSMGTAANVDSIAPGGLVGLYSNSFSLGFDGTNWQRLRVDSAKNLNVTANGMTATPSTAQVSVGTTATALRVGASDLTNRKAISLFNLGSSVVYIGGSGVTATTGFPLQPNTGKSYDQQPGTTASIYAISASGSNTIAVEEIA